MRVLTSILLMVLCVAVAGAQTGHSTAVGVGTLFKRLEKANTASAARATAGKLAELGAENGEARKYLSEHLPALIKGSHGWPWLNAVRLAGRLKLRDDVPELVAMVVRQDTVGGSITFAQEMRLDDDPAGKALVEIGEPSVGPVAQVLERGNRQARWRAALILMNIGTPAAVQAVRNRIPKEQDPDLRRFMESFFKGDGADTAAGKRK